MGFFDRPEPDPHAADDEAWEDLEPGPWIGGVVPMEVIVAHTERAIVLVTNLIAYPDGFRLMVTSSIRRSVDTPRPSWGFGRWSPGSATLPSDLLRFGLAWPDGGQATSVDPFPELVPDRPRPTCGLMPNGGGGGGRTYVQEYWAWPLPVAGDVTAVAEWPAYDLPETSRTISGDALREAAGRARAVWPEDADQPSHRNPWDVMHAVEAMRVERGFDG